jgi:acetyltransferase-like isoleucine patch superfamily enzyme
MNTARTLPWDWHAGTVPENVALDETAYLETTYSFHLYRNRGQRGLSIGRGASVYTGTMFDVGAAGNVKIGEFAVVNPAWIICDASVEIGPYALISWNVVLMDSYRVPMNVWQRRFELQNVSTRSPRILESISPARPIRLERNVWVGFDCCILPGVTIGEGSVIGARSVVASDIPPFTVAAGNPARVVRAFTKEEIGDVYNNYTDTCF